MQQRCTKADHKNQCIIGVCIDYECSSQKPYCNSCLSSHQSHIQKLISFECFNDWFIERNQTIQAVQNFIQDCLKSIEILNSFIITLQTITINEIQESSLTRLDQIIKDFCYFNKMEDESLDNMKTIIEMFDELTQRIHKLKGLQHQQSKENFLDSNNLEDCSILQSQDEQFFSRLSWQNYLKDDQESVLNNQSINSIKTQPEQNPNDVIVYQNSFDIFSNKTDNCKQINEQIIQPIQQQQVDQNIEQNLEQSTIMDFQLLQINKFKIRFSNLNNTRNVILSKENKNLRFSPFSFEQLNFLDSSTIPPFGIHRFSIKILQLGQIVHIGIADRLILKKQDFKPNLDGTKHGTYVINNTGQIYSHLQQQNDQPFQFFQDDIIMVEVNMQNTSITWTRLSTQFQFSMKFEFSQDLSPFIRLATQRPLNSIIEVFEDF